MAIEEYNERVRMQQLLDDTFPRGAFVTIVWIVDGVVVPSGVELTVGRLFVNKSWIVDGSWVHEILLDPSIEPELQGFQIHVPIRGLSESPDHEDLWEMETYTPEIEWIELARFREPLGPRKPVEGQREAVTAIWEERLFPDGLEMKGVRV